MDHVEHQKPLIRMQRQYTPFWDLFSRSTWRHSPIKLCWEQAIQKDNRGWWHEELLTEKSSTLPVSCSPKDINQDNQRSFHLKSRLYAWFEMDLENSFIQGTLCYYMFKYFASKQNTGGRSLFQMIKQKFLPSCELATASLSDVSIVCFQRGIDCLRKPDVIVFIIIMAMSE